MKTLSKRLYDLAQGEYFDGAALRLAYENDNVTNKDRHVLSRYMHGAELCNDRFRLQDIAIKLQEVTA